MTALFFKCKCCGEYVRMHTSPPSLFAGMAYCAPSIEWSEFHEDVPVLSEKHWVRSDVPPIINEKRTLCVQKPFDECIGNTFFALFEPALIAINGWDYYYENDIPKCAIARCRFERILTYDDYTAWIVVKIQDVTPVSELCERYPPTPAENALHFDGITEDKVWIEFQNKNWIVKSWTAQGDLGEVMWIYTDNNGLKHKVMFNYQDFHDNTLYFGNIIPKE